MIHSISCDQPSFRPIMLRPGMNVVLAERTLEETKLHSRNGLGKSSFLDVIQFLLGSDYTRSRLKSDELLGWTFVADLELRGSRVSVLRNTKSANMVSIEGDISTWNNPRFSTLLASDKLEISIDEWNQKLGHLMFDLSQDGTAKYEPRFRSLVSYLIRRNKDAYANPFEHHRKQRVFETQVNNAFLLGLEDRHAAEFQQLKDQKRELDQLKAISASGPFGEMLGSIGELQVLQIRLEEKSRRQANSIRSFRVHEEYDEIESKANELTETIQELAKRKVVDESLLKLYQKNLNDEVRPSGLDVAAVYRQFNVEVPGMVVKHLDEIERFHELVLKNRQSFLEEQIQTLKHSIASVNVRLREKSDERATLMKILDSHGALKEYNEMHTLYRKTESELEETKRKIHAMKKLDEGRSKHRIALENLIMRSRRDLNEREAIRNRAIELFNRNSQALYRAPGNLVIDINKTGFNFNVEIERSGSQGIDNMKIFCYDLMLAQLWSEREPSPRLLVHDSTIFDGVDERQVALALEMAARESQRCGFQYICTLNSDTLPSADFSPGFDIESFVRLRLNDKDDKGSLFGIRF